MNALLALLALVAALDAPRYRDRETAAVRIERTRSNFNAAALWQASRRSPTVEVEVRTNAIAERWYGYALGTLTAEDLADLDAIIAALARPDAHIAATKIAYKRPDARRWTLRLWPVLTARLRRVYGHEWAHAIDFDADSQIDVYTIGVLLWDLHRSTTGEERPW